MNKFKKLIRWARVTASSLDDKDFPVNQVEYMGKTADCMMIFPYGMHANPESDALVLMTTPNGDSANRAGIPGTPQLRPKMSAGEFSLYHPKTQSIIHFRNSGDIDIDTIKNNSANININTVNANITATTKVTIDSPLAEFTGDVSISGKLDVTQNITSLANVIATLLTQGATLSISGSGSIQGKDFISHSHAQGNDSNGDTQVNTGGVA